MKLKRPKKVFGEKVNKSSSLAHMHIPHGQHSTQSPDELGPLIHEARGNGIFD